MSITNSLSNALSGMNAASRMAEVVSSNVSNALTDGYGRRSLNLSSAVVGGRGAGVEVGSVNRHIDRGVLADRRLADADIGQSGALVSTMNQIQDVFGRPGDGDSISARIVAVESALIDAATDPSSDIRLSALGDQFAQLAEKLNTASREIQGQRADADAAIASQVDQLNASLLQVEQLNSDITYSRNSGGDPSGLLDQRQRIVDVIATIVPIRELDRDGGQIALMTVSGESLIDGRAKEFGFVPNPVITSDMTLQSGGLSGLTLDGVALSDDGIGKLTGGSLGAAFDARDTELVAAQSGLDLVAADLINRFQDPNVDPTLTPGQAGILTDAGGAFDAANIDGLAARIAVNSLVDPDQGGSVTNYRDGIASVGVGPSGNADLLQSMLGALSDPRSNLTDTTTKGAAGRAASLEAEMGDRRLSFEAELSFANARWSGLKEAEAMGGVDTDYEMQMLLRVEQAYAANARVVQTVETLMQRLMEI